MNMKEIAQLAGVTAATVSNAINGTGNVSEKKRKEIMEIIEREGYSPNRFAKSLRTKESFIPEFDGEGILKRYSLTEPGNFTS